MSESNGHKGTGLAPTGGMKLTAKQERFAQLIALEGLSQSEAYRQAYDAENMLPATVHNNAYKLMQDNEITTRITELRDAVQTQSIASRERIVEELAKVAFAERQEGPVRDADKTAALDKLAKVAGLYQDADREADRHPINITHVTVVLSHGKTETRKLPDAPPQHVIDGESRTLPKDETDRRS